MNIVLGGDGASFSQSIEQAQRQLNKLKGQTGDFATASVRSFNSAGQSAGRFGHTTVTSVQAASGALRELNGDITNNIRAVERFVTTIPGVGNALKAIYPAVGALAIGGMFYEGIKKANEFIQTLNKMPVVIKQAFGELHNAANASNDAMAISIDRIEMEIAKLQHKPENGLKKEIDETTASVHELSSGLEASISKANELLNKNKVGFWGGLLGKVGTEKISKVVTDTNNEVSGINQSYDETYDLAVAGGATPQNLREIRERKAAKLQDAYSRGGRTVKSLTDHYGDLEAFRQRTGGAFGTDDTSAASAIGFGALRQWDDEQKTIGSGMLKMNDSSKLGSLQVGKANEDEQKKADEKLYKSMQVELDKEKELRTLSVAYEYQYWKQRMDAFTQGSTQYAEIEAKVASLAIEQRKETSRKISDFKKEQKRASAEDATELPSVNKSMADVKKLLNTGNEQHANSLEELNTVLGESVLRMNEQLVGFDLARGAITKHDAAVKLATLHAAAYNLELQKLDQAAKNDSVNASLTPDESRERQDKRNVQRGHVIAQYAATSYSDQQAIGDTSLIGATTSALEEFIAATKDSAAQIKNFTDQSLSSFNDQVIKSLTTRDHSSRREFSNLGANIFRSAAGTGLGKVEGFGLSALGLGGGKKPTGAAGDPLHVVMEGAGAGSALGGINALFDHFGQHANNAGGIASSAVSDVGDFAQSGAFSGLSSLSDVIPFLAEGGALSAGTMAMVGESGPELFVPKTAGDIIPNNKLGGRSGSGALHLHSHVDARGSTDPAQIQAIVDRSWRVNGPIHGRAIMAAIKDDRRRRSSISRG